MKKVSNRRQFIYNSGFLAAIPMVTTSEKIKFFTDEQNAESLDPNFPSQDIASVREIVSAAHARFDRVKELVNERPALAKGSYDWGYGDWETPLGAAAHMGRKDIAEFLIEHGARPTIFSFAMLGKIDTVKAMVEAIPNIQQTRGPHGITLMSHVKSQLRYDNIDSTDKKNIEDLISYLEKVGGADDSAPAESITDDEKQRYVGKYVFGTGENDYFNVKLNSRGSLSIARGEDFGASASQTRIQCVCPRWFTCCTNYF